MNKHIDTVCWTTVSTLQQKMAKNVPGAFWYDVYDHAIELILSGNRHGDPYLLRNAVRDARSTVIRRKCRKQQIETVQIDALGSEDALSKLENNPSIVASRPSPTDTQIAATEMVCQLRTRLTTKNPHAGSVLEYWLIGESVNSTADRLGISRDYIKKLRKMVRSVANDLFAVSEAA